MEQKCTRFEYRIRFIITIIAFLVIMISASSNVAYAREPATQQEFLGYANAAVDKDYPAGLCLKFVSDFFSDGYGKIAGMGFTKASGLTSAYYCYYHHVDRHDNCHAAN